MPTFRSNDTVGRMVPSGDCGPAESGDTGVAVLFGGALGAVAGAGTAVLGALR